MWSPEHDRKEKVRAIEESQVRKRQLRLKHKVAAPEEAIRRQFVNFAFYKLDPSFRRLPKERKEAAKKEFLEVLEEYDANSDMILLGYTMVGIRADVDIMLLAYKLRNGRISRK